MSDGVRPRAIYPVDAGRLWQLSEQLTGATLIETSNRAISKPYIRQRVTAAIPRQHSAIESFISSTQPGCRMVPKLHRGAEGMRSIKSVTRPMSAFLGSMSALCEFVLPLWVGLRLSSDRLDSAKSCPSILTALRPKAAVRMGREYIPAHTLVPARHTANR